jgi:hypothetical protein
MRTRFSERSKDATTPIPVLSAQTTRVRLGEVDPAAQSPVVGSITV